MLNIDKFKALIIGLCEMYNHTPSEFLFSTYYEIFKKYTDNEFEKAVMLCIKTNKYNTLPKPAEIINNIEGCEDDRALEAWCLAKKAVKTIGYYETPDFKDPKISHCLNELGGWMNFCCTPLAEMPFIEKRFLDLYKLFLRKEINCPKKLIGCHEKYNCELGYDSDKPIRIGYINKKDKKIENKETRNIKKLFIETNKS